VLTTDEPSLDVREVLHLLYRVQTLKACSLIVSGMPGPVGTQWEKLHIAVVVRLLIMNISPDD
jgi:hypothetical protein